MLCDVGMVLEVEVAGGSAPGFGSYQVSYVAVNVENHVAGVETNVGVWVCVYVVHESLSLFFVFMVGCACALAMLLSSGRID